MASGNVFEQKNLPSLENCPGLGGLPRPRPGFVVSGHRGRKPRPCGRLSSALEGRLARFGIFAGQDREAERLASRGEHSAPSRWQGQRLPSPRCSKQEPLQPLRSGPECVRPMLPGRRRANRPAWRLQVPSIRVCAGDPWGGGPAASSCGHHYWDGPNRLHHCRRVEKEQLHPKHTSRGQVKRGSACTACNTCVKS